MMYNAKRLKYNWSEIYMGKKKLILAGIVSAGVLGTAAVANLLKQVKKLLKLQKRHKVMQVPKKQIQLLKKN